MDWPCDSDGKKLYLQCEVVIHGVPDDSVKSMLNGQEGQCSRYDHIVKRVYVKVNQDTLAFSSDNLKLKAPKAEASEPITQESAPSSSAEFPRGSGGVVLYPGTIVQIHGLCGARASLNGKEAACEYWDKGRKLMDVRMRIGGHSEVVSNKHLRKISLQDREALGPEASRVMDIFRQYDVDGDGLLDYMEFESMLSKLGMGKCLAIFLKASDKDGDCQINYEEFLEWALCPVGHSRRSNMELMWPVKRSAGAVEKCHIEASVEGEEFGRELCLEDVERICKGSLPEGWPSHGLSVLNNMHSRFPEYPVEGIVLLMARNDFHGGKVMGAIRNTGSIEVEVSRPGAVKIDGAFPATYEVTSNDGMPVYEEGARAWSFKNMRDRKLEPVGKMSRHQRFQLLEVRRGSEYGFCFGLIQWSYGKPGTKYWVDLGLETVSGLRTDVKKTAFGHLTKDDLHFTDAQRISEFRDPNASNRRIYR